MRTLSSFYFIIIIIIVVLYICNHVMWNKDYHRKWHMGKAWSRDRWRHLTPKRQVVTKSYTLIKKRNIYKTVGDVV